jgi:Uri superfamily endonuclease
MYAYVGSALGGIEQRVRRHKSTSKRRRWHIDYLLEKASVTGTVAIPGDRKSIECGVAQALLRGDSAAVVAEGFGSSDCGCRSHLIYFGDLDPECVAETISMALAMLQCVYPKDVSR